MFHITGPDEEKQQSPELNHLNKGRYSSCRWIKTPWVSLDVTALVHSTDYLFDVQYIPRNMHTVFALLCFVVVIHWLIFPYPSGLLHWHCGNLTIAPVPAKQPWWIWINTSCEFIMNDCITTTKQSTTKPCAYVLGYTVVTTSLDITNKWLVIIKICNDFIFLFRTLTKR